MADPTRHGGGRPPAVEVLLAIRDYVANFFTCRECSSHFGEMAAGMEDDLRVAKDAVLWLWKAHNRVNLRLKGDNSEDPMRSKTAFPPVTLCGNCWKPGLPQRHDEQRTFEFLVEFYNRDAMVPASIGAYRLWLLCST